MFCWLVCNENKPMNTFIETHPNISGVVQGTRAHSFYSFFSLCILHIIQGGSCARQISLINLEFLNNDATVLTVHVHNYCLSNNQMESSLASPANIIHLHNFHYFSLFFIFFLFMYSFPLLSLQFLFILVLL